MPICVHLSNGWIGFLIIHMITITLSDPESAKARAALAQYYTELADAFAGGFDVTQSRDPDADALRPPKGGFFLALHMDRPVGCVALKGGGMFGEIKRLWVCPAVRGQGLARRLMEAAEAHAREMGVNCLRLDTNRALPDAISMYRRWGWAEIDRFNDDPYAHVFFEKQL